MYKIPTAHRARGRQGKSAKWPISTKLSSPRAWRIAITEGQVDQPVTQLPARVADRWDSFS